MASKTPKGKTAAKSVGGHLMVRLDEESKAFIAQAAKARRISVSDYVRQTMVGQARREVQQAAHGTLVLTAEEQLAFWNALNEAPQLTGRQRELGAVMRGER